MKLTPTDIDVSSLIISPEQAAPRSKGVHVSAVIDYMMKTIGRRDNSFTDADLDRFAMIGRAFEQVLAQATFKPPRYERIGEIECDDIIGSPDAIDISTGAVQEYKVRWHSSAKPIQEQREIFWQVMSYCHMVGTPRATLVVLYVCGDWRPPVPTWPPKAWNVLFTPAELRDNWAMMMRNKKEMEAL